MITTNTTLLTQVPRGTPNPGESMPLDFTDPFELIVFIILPILIIVFYILWRKQNKKNDS